jgi:hypothetical protein
VLEKDTDVYAGNGLDGELYDNDVGGLDAYCVQEDMNNNIMKHNRIYNRCYASDEDGPREDVHEEDFTTKEAEAFSKVVSQDHWTLLFCDLSLADKVVVTGGTSK